MSFGNSSLKRINHYKFFYSLLHDKNNDFVLVYNVHAFKKLSLVHYQ